MCLRLHGWLHEYSWSCFRKEKKKRSNLCFQAHFHFEETPPTGDDITLKCAGSAHLWIWRPLNKDDSRTAGSCTRAWQSTHNPPMCFTAAVSVPAKTNESCPYCLLSSSVSEGHVPDLLENRAQVSPLNGLRNTDLSHEIIYRSSRHSSATANQLPEPPCHWRPRLRNTKIVDRSQKNYVTKNAVDTFRTQQ